MSSSPLWTIEATPHAGRGVIASQAIPSGTTVHIANDLSAHVLLREYRGEVCWECFAYNRGKKLPLRDANHGFSFCSTACSDAFTARYDAVGMEAWAVVERLAKAKGKARQQQQHAATTGSSTSSSERPSVAAIDQAWASAEQTAEAILRARTGGGNKADQRILTLAASAPPPPADTLLFQTHALLLAHYDEPQGSFAASIRTLEADATPYLSQAELDDYIAAYLHLVAALPVAVVSLLQRVGGGLLREVKAREVRNSFGIRSLDDAGAEFFGFGVWVSASWFNHSCAPNVVRRRVGRTWVFETVRAVGEGEELVISYMNGEEEELSVLERRERLKRTWGFECACRRCSGSV